jgi:uncharacterized DUF497 family protein
MRCWMEIGFASQKIENKLAARGITVEDITACFRNREGGFATETRPEHVTVPPTLWFIAEDDKGRLLKVIFMYFTAGKEAHIKSAYEANDKQQKLYEPFK